MKVVILCGGRGTRINELSSELPKPMIPIGGKPMLWHIMKYFSSFGHNEFILPVGYKGNKIKEYFSNYQLNSDIEINLKQNKTKQISKNSEPWNISIFDTGVDTLTAKRIKLILNSLKDEELFCVTYGDGLADIDINELIKFHTRTGKIATVSGTTPITRFGVIRESNGIVTSFSEKPESKDLINMGFIIMNKSAKNYFDDSDTALEDSVLPKLVKDKQLAIYKHKGFFYAMDTYREFLKLNKLWRDNPKWKRW